MADQNATPTTGENNTGGTTPTPEANKNGGSTNGQAPEGGNAGGSQTNDQDVIKHPVYQGVFNDLKSTRQELKELKEWKEGKEKEALEAEGKHKELAEKAQAEANEYKTKFEQSSKFNAFVTEAAKAGITSIDDAWKLADQSKLTLGDDGKVEGVDALVKDLVENKPFLLGETAKKNVGAPSAPAGEDGSGEKPTFKRSQLKDSKFYEENKVAILAAAREGRIIDDVDATT